MAVMSYCMDSALTSDRLSGWTMPYAFPDFLLDAA